MIFMYMKVQKAKMVWKTSNKFKKKQYNSVVVVNDTRKKNNRTVNFTSK